MITKKDLNKIKKETLPKISLRYTDGKIEEVGSVYEKQVLICRGTGCTSSLSDEIEDKFHKLVEENKLEDKVSIIRTGCFGLCEAGPIVIVNPGEIFYSHIDIEDVNEIFKEHILDNNIVRDLLYEGSIVDDEVLALFDVEFYSKQNRVALRNCGFINPECVDEYIARDGYYALHNVLTEKTSEEVIDIIKDSNLKGRGGGGFPAGIKWEFTKDAKDDVKYIICNADEGDPGAFMDRSILEGDPHSVLEAMAIAGYAVGSNQGYIYIRAEYPMAIERLNISIASAKELGFIGDNIFGTDFSFDIELRLGAGAFVCGEEMALIESIEGKRGVPRNKPPFPANKGLWNKPTLINNVETYANVPQIILNGADWFKSFGTEDSPGTKVFALGGNINRTGLVEVEMGTTLREVIFEVGGGIPKGREFKAIQTGGPSGGCLTAENLDLGIDFSTLTAHGSMMGSGGMVVMDDETCMVDIARFFLDFTVSESCGRCTPCREGTKRMLEILEKMVEGKGTLEDIDTLENLGETIKLSSLCGLGQTAPNPVLSTIKHFRDEYEAHVVDKTCPAGQCPGLTKLFITDSCIGCGLCARKCPVDAIKGRNKEIHVIDTDLCIMCGNCEEVCPTDSVIRV